jgi:L-ribulose-5-phosphate 3-epimerase
MPDRLSLASWSFRRRFFEAEPPLDLLEYPRVARDEFGFEGVELNNRFFPSTDPGYLATLRECAGDAGVALLNITVNRCGDMADPATWRDVVEQHTRWLEVAAALGCASIRANTGGEGSQSPEEALATAQESFAALATRGAERGVRVLIENHGGLSADPDAIVAIVEAVNSAWIGTIPDFGNFAPEVRYEGLQKIAPYARLVHAKFYDFAPDGSHPTVDIARCVEIVRQAGYEGWWSIEYEGSGDDHDGIARSRDVVRSLLE